MAFESTALPRRWRAIAVLFCACIFLPNSAVADTLVVQDLQGQHRTFEGKVLVAAKDKSLLFQAVDGQLHIFRDAQIVSRTNSIGKVAPMTHEELGASLLKELPQGFRIYTTDHFVIAYQTDLDYAKWVGKKLCESLYSKFKTFARKTLKGYQLLEPQFPLPVVVFQSKPEYAAYVIRELGSEVGSMIAHYNQKTNRIAMYDLTFDLGRAGQPLEAALSDPAAIPMVATIIHEGTHQLMYNRGMQTRLADGPLWLNEGMANWFETPDLRKSKGWSNPGLLNELRLTQFRKYMKQRPANSLETLINSDARFAAEGEAIAAYAESWALVYYLLKKKPRAFRDYMQAMSEKKVGYPVDAKTRMADFVEYFGDLGKLDKAFLKYILKQ
jgi:hypothetical protein